MRFTVLGSFYLSGNFGLARISHKLAAATADASVLTVFRSVGLLDVLHEYDCGGLGRKPCQTGASTVSLHKPVRNAG